MKTIAYLQIFFLFLANPVFAATTDFVADGGITVSGVAYNSTTADLTILNGSRAESWSIDNGVFTVTNPNAADFKISCSDSNVGAIKIENSINSAIDCTTNSVPGTTSTTLSSLTAVFTITPVAIAHAATYNSSCGAASCASGYGLSGSGESAVCVAGTCPSLAGAAAYNAYPTCGAATCESGYTLSGSGSSATCLVVSSGGGGGSLPQPSQTANTVDAVSTQESYLSTPDGAVIESEITTTNDESGTPVESEIEAVISSENEMTEAQTLSLDTEDISDFKAVEVNIPAVALEDLRNRSASKSVKVVMRSKEASEEQKSYEARSGNFLVGYDIFEVELSAGDQAVEELPAPITLSFDISNSKYKDRGLKVYYFDEVTKKWELAGSGGSISNDILTVVLDHLTIFAIIFPFKVSEAKAEEETIDKRTLQMESIYKEANIVYKSGRDLGGILSHNKAAMDVEKQKNGMEKYTDILLAGQEAPSTAERYAINNFIVYGTESTQALGAGERAGTLNSYKKAFGKLPSAESEWKDCLAIANGRWPGELSEAAEEKAKEEFKNIYLREAGMSNSNDNAAVTVIAYGLRPDDRNLNSEAAAIKIFAGIYKYDPVSALDWDIVRAIAYSGASR